MRQSGRGARREWAKDSKRVWAGERGREETLGRVLVCEVLGVGEPLGVVLLCSLKSNYFKCNCFNLIVSMQ